MSNIILKMLGIFAFSKCIFIWAARNFMYIKFFKFKKLKHYIKCFVYLAIFIYHISQYLVLQDEFYWPFKYYFG